MRLLLDSFFDEPQANRRNQATVEYLAAIAAAEGLDIADAVGNPTGGGIHAKWLLKRMDWDEISCKIDRPAILVIAVDKPKLGRNCSHLIAASQFMTGFGAINSSSFA